MLDLYLEMAVKQEKLAAAKAEMQSVLMRFPVDELQKIATSGCILTKTASDGPWAARFQGTPLFEQAIALEQEAIQMDIENQNRRKMDQEYWSMRDTIDLKKRLLELDLVRQSEQANAQAEEEAAVAEQAAAAAPPEEESKPAKKEEPKTAGINGAMLTGLGTKALNFAKANPGVVAGAVGGAALGASQGEGVGGRLAGGLAGAVGGAGLGAAGQVGVNTAKLMSKNPNKTLGSALKGAYNNQLTKTVTPLGYHPSVVRPLMAGVK